MTSKSYLGQKHVFTSKSDNPYAEISAGKDEELYIENLRTKSVYYSDFSDNLNFNELGTSADYQHTNTPVLQQQGTSISIAKTGSDNYLAVGCPIPFSDALGGIAPFKSESGNPFIESSALTQTSATHISVNGIYSDINEDGDLIVFTDYDQFNPTIQTYRRSGSVWSPSDFIAGAGRSCKVSSVGSNDYMITCGKQKDIYVYIYTGGSWSMQQTLKNPGAPGTELTPLEMIGGNVCAFNDGSGLQIWNRVGVNWTESQSISMLGIIGLSMVGTIMTFCTSSKLFIYEKVGGTYALINEFDITGITDTCTNGTYVFCSSTSAIRVYSKVGLNWVRSTNNTSDTGSYKIACSEDFLAVGKKDVGTYGHTTVYPISSYVNTLVTTNSVVLNGTDLELTSIYGNIVLDPPISVSVEFPDGTEASPGIFFTDQTDTGIYRKATDTIGISTGGSDVLVVNDTQLLAQDGTVSLPSYSFESATNTGFYTTGGSTLGIAIGAVEKVSIDTDFSNFTATTALNGYGYETGAFAQALPNSVWTVLTNYWDGIPVLTGDTSSTRPSFSGGVYTINKTGRYHISVQCSIGPNSAGYRSLSLLINGVQQSYSNIPPVVGDRTGMGLSIVLELNDTDTVSARIFQTSGVTLFMSVLVPGEFTIYRLN